MSIANVCVGGIVLGSAKAFRWLQRGPEVHLVATLTTDRKRWAEIFAKPDDPVAAYAGPYKVLRGLPLT